MAREDGDMDITLIDNVQRQGLIAQIQPATPEVAAQRREVVQAVKALNKAEPFGDGRELTYSIDRRTHRIVTRVVDRSTGDVVSQLPAEYVLRMAEEYQKQP